MQFMVFLSHFYPLSHFFPPDSSVLYCALIFHSFLWPNNVHHIDLPYFCLCICTLVLGVVVWKRNAPPIDLDIWIFGPQLVVVWEVVGPSGVGSLLTEVCHTGRWTLRIYGLTHFPLGLSFMIGFEDVSSQLLVPAAYCWTLMMDSNPFRTNAG